MAINRNYGKLADGAITYAPKVLRIDGKVIGNPRPETYALADWLPVVNTPPTDPAPEGKHWEAQGWAEDGGSIVRQYALVDDPPAPPRRWTPLSIKRTVAAAGHWDALKSAMESADKFDEFLMAQYIVEDDASYAAMRSAAIAIAGSEEAADALIAQIPQEA